MANVSGSMPQRSTLRASISDLLSGASLYHLVVFTGALLLFSLVYLSRTSYSKQQTPDQLSCRPPTYPSRLPLIDHALSMGWNARSFLSSVIAHSAGVPTRIRLLLMDVYVISSPAHIITILKSPHVHYKAYKQLPVQNMFGMPAATLAFWLSDDSGIATRPHPDSAVPPHHRIEHLEHAATARLLTGKGLKAVEDRFVGNLCAQLAGKTEIGAQWVRQADLFKWLREELTTATLRAVCGDYLLRLNTGFVEEFWDFDRDLSVLAKLYPRWAFPAPYEKRDGCLQALRRWHAFIGPYLDAEGDGLGVEAWSKYYGAEMIREKHRMWQKMPCVGAESAAAMDLGFIWGINANSNPSSLWLLAEVIRDRSLLSRVRAIIDACYIPPTLTAVPSNRPRLNLTVLLSDPLLQSLYAETLRLRVASFVFRSPDRHSLHLDHWRIPQDAVILISTYHAQMDPVMWEGKGERPVAEFWPDRFLAAEGQKGEESDLFTTTTTTATTTMGPHGNGTTSLASATSTPIAKANFSMKGRANSWIPYGGGQRICPGRHFNKSIMIATLAIVLAEFDVELLPIRPEQVDAEGRVLLPEPDWRGFGFGALAPRGEMPFRIRRRGLEERKSE